MTAPPMPQEYAPFQAVTQLTKLYWNREYVQIWPLLATTDWPEAARPLVEGFAAQFRTYIIALINRAFSTVRTSTACAMLGMTQEQLGEGARAFAVFHSVACPAINAHHNRACMEVTIASCAAPESQSAAHVVHAFWLGCCPGLVREACSVARRQLLSTTRRCTGTRVDTGAARLRRRLSRRDRCRRGLGGSRHPAGAHDVVHHHAADGDAELVIASGLPYFDVRPRLLDVVTDRCRGFSLEGSRDERHRRRPASPLGALLIASISALAQQPVRCVCRISRANETGFACGFVASTSREVRYFERCSSDQGRRHCDPRQRRFMKISTLVRERMGRPLGQTSRAQAGGETKVVVKEPQ